MLDTLVIYNEVYNTFIGLIPASSTKNYGFSRSDLINNCRVGNICPRVQGEHKTDFGVSSENWILKTMLISWLFTLKRWKEGNLVRDNTIYLFESLHLPDPKTFKNENNYTNLDTFMWQNEIVNMNCVLKPEM